MKTRSKRALSTPRAVKLGFGFAVVIIVAGLLILSSLHLFRQSSPFIEKILSHKLGRQVSITSISYGFPMYISLHDIEIRDRNGTDVFFKAGRLDVRPGPAIFKGKLDIGAIRMIEPFINIYRTGPDLFNFGSTESVKKVYARLTHTTDKTLYNPLNWALRIDNTQVSIAKGHIHLNDETEHLPQIDGFFDLIVDLSLNNSKETFNGELLLRHPDFFHRGIKGRLAGTLQFNAHELIPDVRLLLSESKTSVAFTGKIRDYTTSPIGKIHISAENPELSLLKFCRFPLILSHSPYTITGSLTGKGRADKETYHLAASYLFTPKILKIQPLTIINKARTKKINGNIVIATNDSKPEKTLLEPELSGHAGLVFKNFTFAHHPLKKAIDKTLGITIPEPVSPVTGRFSLAFNQGIVHIAAMHLQSSNQELQTEGIHSPATGDIKMMGEYTVARDTLPYNPQIESSAFAENEEFSRLLQFSGNSNRPDVKQIRYLSDKNIPLKLFKKQQKNREISAVKTKKKPSKN